MARIAVIEQRLGEWAVWRRRATRSEPPDPARDVGVGETDAAVRALPSPLRETIETCYGGSGDMAVHAALLGCPHWVVTRRIGRAHLMLREGLRATKEAEVRAAELVSIEARRTREIESSD